MICAPPVWSAVVIVIEDQAVRVLIGGAEPISDDTRSALAELIRDAWRRFEAEQINGAPPALEREPVLASAGQSNCPPPGVQTGDGPESKGRTPNDRSA